MLFKQNSKAESGSLFKQNSNAESGSLFRRNPNPISEKKKIATSAVVVAAIAVPLVPKAYIGEVLWSAMVLSFVALAIYVVWFMKD